MCDVRRKQTNSAYVRSRNGNSRILLAKRDNGKPYLEVILPANFELTGANFSEFEKFLFLFNCQNFAESFSDFFQFLINKLELNIMLQIDV